MTSQDLGPLIVLLVVVVLFAYFGLFARRQAGGATGGSAQPTFGCEGCGNKLKAPAGRKARCPSCQTVTTVPAASTKSNNQKSKPDIDLLCPICGRTPVQTAESLYLVRGLVIFGRMGSYPVVGCQSCVSRAARREASLTAVLGIWCVPWGLLAPLAALLNLAKSFRRSNRRKLDAVLALAGLSLAYLEIGSDGLSGAERNYLAAVAKILASVAIVSGTKSAEWAAARQIVIELSQNRMSEAQVDSWMRRLANEKAARRESAITALADRLMILRVAVEVALTDRTLSSDEYLALSNLTSRLGLRESNLDEIVDLLTEVSSSPGGERLRPELADAYETLGLTRGASSSEIRMAHKALILKHHPDIAPDHQKDEATRLSAEINRARDTLLGASDVRPS
jgi:LSD1 subclass zinc finger protein